MMTNTFTPHVGGVARSVESFTAEYRRRGHRVLVVAPEFENMPEDEVDVVRVPAIQHFNGSDFSVSLPLFGHLADAVEDFRPDVVHSHHPFLIGASAVRIARLHDLPLVFTHHTMYEQYTHYVPGNSEPLKRFVIRLSTSYANLCNQVFAPSESVAAVLRERGVRAPIDIVPTGVDLARFEGGSGEGFRAAVGIPPDAFVVGHVGRLAAEKNLGFLTDALIAFMSAEPRAHVLVAGGGPWHKTLRDRFAQAGLLARVHLVGVLEKMILVSAYKAMDVFAFSSRSETQGMVLTEAMAAGVPVVAVDASGVREVVRDRLNGRLLAEESVEGFAAALAWMTALAPAERAAMRARVAETARAFSIEATAGKALDAYAALREASFGEHQEEIGMWNSALRRVRAEWELLRSMAGAAGVATTEPPGPERQ